MAMFDSYFSFGIIQSLPERPEYWSIWIYIFGMPHVFASFLLLADKEYIQEFKSNIIISASILLSLPPLLSLFFDFYVIFFIFTAMIVYHTVAQQFGLSLIASRSKPNFAHKANTILASLVGVVLYTYMYSNDQFSFAVEHKADLVSLAKVLFIIVTGLSLFQFITSNTRQGRIFVFLNWLLIGSILGFFLAGLEVLSIIIGRIIHEFSAWIIYGVHDHNRNLLNSHNLAYKYLPIPTQYAGIVLAFVFGIAITFVSESHASFLAMLIISFSLFHYWIERFIWKGKSGPKQNVRFS